MNDDSTILLTSKDIVGMSSNSTVTSGIMSSISATTNNIKSLEEHIDYLHTKIGYMEERLSILESIVLKKD